MDNDLLRAITEGVEWLCDGQEDWGIQLEVKNEAGNNWTLMLRNQAAAIAMAHAYLVSEWLCEQEEDSVVVNKTRSVSAVEQDPLVFKLKLEVEDEALYGKEPWTKVSFKPWPQS